MKVQGNSGGIPVGAMIENDDNNELYLGREGNNWKQAGFGRRMWTREFRMRVSPRRLDVSRGGIYLHRYAMLMMVEGFGKRLVVRILHLPNPPFFLSRGMYVPQAAGFGSSGWVIGS